MGWGRPVGTEGILEDGLITPRALPSDTAQNEKASFPDEDKVGRDLISLSDLWWLPEVVLI